MVTRKKNLILFVEKKMLFASPLVYFDLLSERPSQFCFRLFILEQVRIYSFACSRAAKSCLIIPVDLIV